MSGAYNNGHVYMHIKLSVSIKREFSTLITWKAVKMYKPPNCFEYTFLNFPSLQLMQLLFNDSSFFMSMLVLCKEKHLEVVSDLEQCV